MNGSGILSHEESHGETDLRDIEICRDIATVLMDHYPGHVWHVAADSGPTVGMADIKLNYPDRLGVLPKFGYKLLLATITPEKIMRAGGELLERYRLARSRATQYAIVDAISNGLDQAGAV